MRAPHRRRSFSGEVKKNVHLALSELQRHARDRRRQRSAALPWQRAIDIPASERRTVMQDLALMGITEGSLFPGLDGACLQLKERFFDL